MQHNISSGNGRAVLKPSWLVRMVIMFPLSAMYKVLQWIVPHFGDVWAKRIVYVMTWLVLFLLRHQRLINICRLFEPLGWTTQQYQTLDKNYLQHHARLIVDSFRLMQFTSEEVRQRVVFQGEEHLATALQQGRGALLAGNHLGNWLFSVAFLSSCGYNVSAVAYEIPIGSIEAHMQRIWRKYDLSITNVGKGAPAAARRAFRKNQLFLVLTDVSLRPVRGKWFRLGNAAINVDTGPAKLALMMNAPILHIANHRQADSRFVISISPEIRRETNIGSEHAEEDLTQYWLNLLHEELLSWPEQWWPMTLIPLKRPEDVPLSPKTVSQPLGEEAL